LWKKKKSYKLISGRFRLIQISIGCEVSPGIISPFVSNLEHGCSGGGACNEAKKINETTLVLRFIPKVKRRNMKLEKRQ